MYTVSRLDAGAREPGRLRDDLLEPLLQHPLQPARRRGRRQSRPARDRHADARPADPAVHRSRQGHGRAGRRGARSRGADQAADLRHVSEGPVPDRRGGPTETSGARAPSTAAAAARSCGPARRHCSIRCCRKLLVAVPAGAAGRSDPAALFGGAPGETSGSRSASAPRRASRMAGRAASRRRADRLRALHERRRQMPRAYRAHGRRQRAAVHR